VSGRTAAVCALTVLFTLLGGCHRSVTGVSPQDVEVLRAVIHPDACNDTEPSVILTEPALAKAPANSGPLEIFGLDLASRPVEQTRWPEFELCPGVKVAASSSVRLTWQISLPVYSPSRKRAVVIVEFHCGPLCGHGEYVELHEIDGVWKITKIEQGWVS
jgi:hypothetical protein